MWLVNMYSITICGGAVYTIYTLYTVLYHIHELVEAKFAPSQISFVTLEYMMFFEFLATLSSNRGLALPTLPACII